MTLVNYSVYCKTEGRYYTTTNLISKPPTKCPINPSHELNNDLTNVVNIVPSFILEQNNGLTNTNYSTRSVSLTASSNTTSSTFISWVYPICPKSMSFITGEIHKGDSISVIVGENTTVSYITQRVDPVESFNSLKNYSVGEMAKYNHPIFGERVYTCKIAPDNKQLPTDKNYWQLGYALHVATTANLELGYFIRLTDGVNTDNMNDIVAIDRDNNIIYLNNNPTHTFLSTGPTYVQLSVYPIKDFVIGDAGRYTFGSGILSSSYVPADIPVTLKYTNNSSTDKFFAGQVEYFY